VQAGVDNLHAGVTKCPGNHLCTPIMPIKPGLGHNNP